MNSKQVILRMDTVEKLHKLRHTGQTYDGVIKELIAENKEGSNNSKLSPSESKRSSIVIV